jgi:hypothetical protein
MVVPMDLRTAARERVRQEEARLGFVYPARSDSAIVRRLTDPTPQGVTYSLTVGGDYRRGRLVIANTLRHPLDVRVLDRSSETPYLFLAFQVPGSSRAGVVTGEFTGIMASQPLVPPLRVEVWTPRAPDQEPVKLGHWDIDAEDVTR